MKTPDFQYKAGQYIFLQCPPIGKYEWHPFTITSCPDDDYVSVHIRVVGDWTGALAGFLNPEKKTGLLLENLSSTQQGEAILTIDGPFGAAAEEAFQFKTVLLIGAGIGVTPYASILKNIRSQIRKAAIASIDVPIKRAYFYWISPDKTSFEWFSELLKGIERENVDNIFEIHIYFTGSLSSDEVRNIMYVDGDAESDQVTGLASRTSFGRPKWDEIFQEKNQQHPNEDIGVFFCGPPALSKVIYKQCVHYTLNSSSKFHYKKENF